MGEVKLPGGGNADAPDEAQSSPEAFQPSIFLMDDGQDKGFAALRRST
jgi:hypothetical protein